MNAHVAQSEHCAKIRAILSPDVISDWESCGFGIGSPFTHAMVLLSHLRPDRGAEAVFAHGVLLADLAEGATKRGMIDPTVAKLATEVFGYLESCGYMWHDNAWTLRDTMFAELP